MPPSQVPRTQGGRGASLPACPSCAASNPHRHDDRCQRAHIRVTGLQAHRGLVIRRRQAPCLPRGSPTLCQHCGATTWGGPCSVCHTAWSAPRAHATIHGPPTRSGVPVSPAVSVGVTLRPHTWARRLRRQPPRGHGSAPHSRYSARRTLRWPGMVTVHRCLCSRVAPPRWPVRPDRRHAGYVARAVWVRRCHPPRRTKRVIATNVPKRSARGNLSESLGKSAWHGLAPRQAAWTGVHYRPFTPPTGVHPSAGSIQGMNSRKSAHAIHMATNVTGRLGHPCPVGQPIGR